MKKLLSTLLFTTLLSITTASTVSAQYSVNCINCSTWVDDLKDYAIQTADYAADKLSSYQNTITAANTTLTRINDTVLKPARDVAAIAQIVSGSQLAMSLGNSLSVADPASYIENKGKEVVQANLGAISGAKGFYSDSIGNYVVNSVRGEDSASKILSLTQSDLPNLIQNKACKDSELTLLAKKAVTKTDGTYDQGELNSYKTSLFNTLCKGDPKKDPKLAETLINAQKQDESIGGPDVFYKVTVQGENDYTRAVLATNAIQKQVDAKKDAKQKDLTAGGGNTKSETVCVKSAPADTAGLPFDDPTANVEGNPSFSIPCLKEAITKSSASVRSLYNESLAAPLKTLQSSLSGSVSLIGTIFNSIGLVGGIVNAVDATGNNLGVATGGSNTPNGSAAVTYTPVRTNGGTSYPTTVTASTPNTFITTQKTYTQDLLQTPALKAPLINPIVSLLNDALSGLDSFVALDQDYLAEINLYESQLASINSCYDKLVTDFNVAKDPSLISFYNSKKATTDALLNQITTEINNVPVAKSLINSTLTAINNSNSTSQISDLFTNYQNQVASQHLPTGTLLATRQSDYQLYKLSVEQDMGTTGSITSYTNQCATLRSQYQAQSQVNQGYTGGAGGF